MRLNSFSMQQVRTSTMGQRLVFFGLLMANMIVSWACGDKATQGNPDGKSLSGDDGKFSGMTRSANSAEISDKELDAAHEPIAVDGAFLTCQVDESSPDPLQVGIGCTYVAQTGTRMVIDRFTFEFRNIAVSSPASPNIQAKLTSWNYDAKTFTNHWVFSVPREHISGDRLQVLAYDPPRAQPFKQMVLSIPNVPASPALSVPSLVPTVEAFALAPLTGNVNAYAVLHNGSWVNFANRDCQQANIRENTLKQPPLDHPRFAVKLPTILTGTSSIKLRLEGVCGMNSRDNPNLPTVTLMNAADNSVLSVKSFVDLKPLQMFEWMNLQAGQYHVIIKDAPFPDLRYGGQARGDGFAFTALSISGSPGITAQQVSTP